MPLDYRPTAPHELSEGYAFAAELSSTRQLRVLAWGDTEEAEAWGKVADYCAAMAKTKATDDDQFQFQRDKERYRPGGEEIVPLDDTVEAELLANLTRPRRELSPWALAVIELALGYLSPMQRVCFELVVGGLIEANDVAEALNITSNQVRAHVSAAKSKFRHKVRGRIHHLIPGTAVYDPRLWYTQKPTG